MRTVACIYASALGWGGGGMEAETNKSPVYDVSKKFYILIPVE